MPEPGWYRDPAGREGDARWWDGAGWTDAHVARESVDAIPDPQHLPGYAGGASSPSAGPGALEVAAPYSVVTPRTNDGNLLLRRAVGSSDAPPAYGAPSMTQTMEPTAPPKTAALPTRTRWVLGGLVAFALVLVLLVTTGVFSPSSEDDNGPDIGAIPTAGPSTDPGVRPTRIEDTEAGISYKYLGVGWQGYDLSPQLEMQTSTGQYIVTQPKVPTGGEFIAQVTSGLLSPQFSGADPAQWAQTVAQVKTSVQGNYYPQPNTTKLFRDEAMQIDGHTAYIMGFDLKWDVDGYDSTGERAMLILLDSGKSTPALIYLSFPNTHAELYPLMDEAVASITVDG